MATLLCAGALGAVGQSALAVNAAWDIDATSGNFNTAQWSSAGTPIAGGTYTVVSGDALVFGTQTTGVTALTNDLTSATYNGLTFNSGASAFTIGGNSFTLNGNITNSSSNLQTINNDMTSTAARTITGGTGGLTFSGAYTTAVAATYAGVINIKGATTISQSGTNNQGFVTVGNGTNSTVTLSNGGSLSINGTTAGGKPNSIVGNNISTSALNVGASDLSSSGTLTVGAETGFVLGNNNISASGTLNVNSGTATINRGSTTATDIRSFVSLGRDTGTGTINLNGGTLATDRNFVRDGSGTADTQGAANFNFNGGTLKALASQTDWLNSSTKNTNQLALTSVTTTSASSTIDSNGFSVAINNNISGAGGFTIISSSGAGTVTFGGANTYTGTTTINSGTLALGAADRIADTSAMVLGGGTFATGGFAETVGTLTINTASIIDFGSGTSALAFANSSSMTWNGTLTLSNFDVGTDTLRFGTDASGLTGSQLSAISLTGYTAALDSNGFVTFTAVPEPHEFALAIVGLLGVMVFIRRRNQQA
jgi:autotransporter-associated beta strand protein